VLTRPNALWLLLNEIAGTLSESIGGSGGVGGSSKSGCGIFLSQSIQAQWMCVHLLRCTACRITATVAPHKLTNIPISVQFVILYLISRNYKRVLEEQLGGHLLWLDVKHAGCLRLASAGAGLLNNAGVGVVLVAVVAVFVLLFAGHLLTTSFFLFSASLSGYRASFHI
jgi:hypothetical protein